MSLRAACLISILAAIVLLVVTAIAQIATADSVVRGARTSVNRTASSSNVNVSHNTNINRNVNVNRDVDVNVNTYGGYNNGCCYHPVAKTAAVAAATVVTAAVIGSMVSSLPPSCSAVSVNGITYEQCGSTWYQPQFAGSSVTYIVVNPPQ